MDFILILICLVLVILGLWWIGNKLSTESNEAPLVAANDDTFAESTVKSDVADPVAESVSANVASPVVESPIVVSPAVTEKPVKLAVAPVPAKPAKRTPAKVALAPKKGKKQPANVAQANKSGKKPVQKPAAKPVKPKA